MKTFLNFRFYSVAILLAGTMFFTACDRDKDPGTNAASEAEEISTVDNSTAENSFDDAVDLEDEVMKDFSGDLDKSTKGGEEKPWKQCATITISGQEGETTVSRQVIIDFKNGCTVRGKTRKGKIIINFTRPKAQKGNPYDATGTTVTTTFDNYSVNDIKVEGTKTVTRIANVGNATRSHSIVISGGKLTFKDGSTSTWESNRTRNYFNNGTILNFEDDTFTVTGTASGKNRRGVNYTANITTTLLWKVICVLDKVFIPVQGIITIQTTNPTRTATVDFGNGDCDNLFTITVNGQSKTIDAGK
ncbi:MAG: hypothetical protein MUE85_07225 [Microscillaceae bacterium]|jgi:hypothetical protein|nr:hypothetical protein [Microscillaceae bacterium]